MLRMAVLRLLLLACLGPAGLVAAAPSLPDPDAQARQALVLPDELRLALAARMPERRLSELERVERLMDFMVADDGLGLRYQEQPTLGIDAAFRQRRVNCLSFTLMFLALARASGLQARAQASGDALAMRVLGDTAFRTSHVNAGVRIAGQWHSVDVGWGALLAGREPQAISDAQAVALLHNNKAVERLVAGDYAAAMAEMELALALDPASATAWSNAGVLHWRSGGREAAERAYLRALALQRHHVGALGNLVGLYRAIGDEQRAASFEKRLRRAQVADPFSQFLIAQALLDTGAYEDAIGHYRRAIRLMPDEPEFHRNLARAYEKQGKGEAAQRARLRADALDARRAAQRTLRTVDTSTPG